MSQRRINCRELVELVTEYLENTLDAVTKARFEDHLGRCDGCGAYVDQMRKTIALAGRLHEDDIAPPAREALLAAFRGWRAEAGKQPT
jgi:predicted anti-sigma-YlaC factor YlaD